MPIKIQAGLPVQHQLEAEGIFTMSETRALTQQIRPLKILIVNLMPKKQITELQLLRLIGNTPLQLEVDFLHMDSHQSKNTSKSYLEQYYLTLDEIQDHYYDGMILTGAPVEQLPFDAVGYIEELRHLLDWSRTHVFNRLFICWGAQFALNDAYGIDKLPLAEKLFGIYPSHIVQPQHPYVRGMDDQFVIPQSRHTTMDARQIATNDQLIVLAAHPDNGPDLLTTVDGRDLYIFGHLEYDRETLAQEYHRDLERGDAIHLPVNYYPDDDPTREPCHTWRSHGHLLFSNWINVTYQDTYYDLTQLAKLSK